MSRITRIKQELFSLCFQRLSREFFWVGLGQILSALGAIVGVRLLTNVLTPDSYGELALGMTVALLTQQVVFGPLSSAILRFFAPALESDQLTAYLKAVKILLLKPTAILVGIGGAVSLGLWAFGHVKWLGLVVTAIVFSLLSGFSSALNGIQNAARHRMIVAWHDGLAQWSRFLAALSLVIILGSFSQVAMLGYAVASAGVFVSQLLFFRRKVLRMITPRAALGQDNVEDYTRQMRNYARPFAIFVIFTCAQQTSDRWALQLFGTTRSVGLYAVLYQLGYYPLVLLSGLMIQLISPVLFGWAGDGSDAMRVERAWRLNKRIVLTTVLLTLLGAILVFLLHKQLFPLLVAPAYREASLFLPVMILSGGLFASGQAASLMLMTGVNPQALIAPKIGTALLGVALNFAGAYWFGLSGVVFASLGFSLVYFVWIFCLTRTTETAGSKKKVVYAGLSPIDTYQ